jgi:hypothetical protein
MCRSASERSGSFCPEFLADAPTAIGRVCLKLL